MFGCPLDLIPLIMAKSLITQLALLGVSNRDIQGLYSPTPNYWKFHKYSFKNFFSLVMQLFDLCFVLHIFFLNSLEEFIYVYLFLVMTGVFHNKYTNAIALTLFKGLTRAILVLWRYRRN